MKRILLILFCAILGACSPSSHVMRNGTPPDWFYNTPENEGYICFTGTGSSPESIAESRRMAIRDGIQNLITYLGGTMTLKYHNWFQTMQDEVIHQVEEDILLSGNANAGKIRLVKFGCDLERMYSREIGQYDVYTAYVLLRCDASYLENILQSDNPNETDSLMMQDPEYKTWDLDSLNRSIPNERYKVKLDNLTVARIKAGASSAIIPGLGQYFNRQKDKALTTMVLFSIFACLTYECYNSYEHYRDIYDEYQVAGAFDRKRDFAEKNMNRSYTSAGICLSIASAVYISSIVDAVVNAHRRIVVDENIKWK